MKFKYKKYGSGITRPVIPIEIGLRTKKLFASYEVLVDSGADICIFDAQIGEILGLDILKGSQQKVAGITGKEEFFYIHPLTFKVGGLSYNTQAGFLTNIAQLGYGVVGQKGFFDIFVVKFDLLKEEIELKPKFIPKD